ncbi:conserved hypothetical protein [Culex quinquefasciatus]|uniref:Uncharacterized protein n=1 Tax=Culex quinquefasciatus TaxID=7176 RepID=B0WVD4_CULQU|nr:conserved hypothetical protein [Culex quinquefasciatus]|eukprot:XP_001861356.1 conserved hypothetical protein [Culex quinquefasciatus]
MFIFAQKAPGRWLNPDSGHENVIYCPCDHVMQVHEVPVEGCFEEGHGSGENFYSQLITHNSQLTTHNSQLTTHNSQLTTHNSQLTTHNSQLTTHNSQLTTHNSQLTTHNSQLTTHKS